MRPCLVAILARRMVHECYVFRCTDITAYRRTHSLGLRLETVVDDLFSGQLVAWPGESLKLDPANLACPNWPPTTGTGIVKRPTPCSVLVGS